MGSGDTVNLSCSPAKSSHCWGMNLPAEAQFEGKGELKNQA